MQKSNGVLNWRTTMGELALAGLMVSILSAGVYLVIRAIVLL